MNLDPSPPDLIYGKLKSALAAWDGKSATYLTRLFDDHHGLPGFLPALLMLVSDTQVDRGATWLLKRLVESGGLVDQAQVIQLVQTVRQDSHWETRLHWLQILPSLHLDQENARTLLPFVRNQISDPVKFVRAWAYGGMISLSRQLPELEDEVARLIEDAVTREPPSVQARIRNSLRQKRSGEPNY